MGIWRVIRTTVRGQFASDECFLKWVGSHPAEIAIAKVVDEPALGDSSNDRRLYIVYQAGELPTPPAGCSPDLVTSGGANGWPTQAQAQAVVDGEVAKNELLNANIKKANEKATSIGNLLPKPELPDIPDPTKLSPLLVAGGLIVLGVVVWKVFK